MNTRTLSTALIALFLLLATASLFAEADVYVSDFNTKYFLGTFKKFRVKYVWKSKNPCEWSGVLCNDAQTTCNLGLPGDQADLSGDLPSFGTDKKFDPSQVLVDAIYLNDNRKLTGAFPAHWYQLSNLQYIGLSGTGLEGTIPESWQLLPRILSIDVSNTKACQSLPQWTRTTSDMAFFSVFNLSGDSWIRGTVPESWSSFAGVRLDFAGTELCGCAPTAVAKSAFVKAQLNPTNPLLFADNCATVNRCGPGATKCGASNTIGNAAASPSLGFTAGLMAALVALVAAVSL